MRLEPPANLNLEPGAGLADPGRGESVRPEPDDLRSRAVRGGLIVMLSRLGTQFFLWAGTFLTFRYLGADDVGIMTWGMLFVGLADLLAEAGVGKALIQRQDLCQRDLDEGFTLTLILSAVGYGILFLLAAPAETTLGIIDFALFLRLLALHLFLIPIRAIPLALLDRRLHMGKQSIIHVSSSVLQAGLVLLLAMQGFGFWSQVTGTLAGRGAEAIALLCISGYRPRLAALGKRAWALISFGFQVSLGSLLWFIYSNADFAIVGGLIGATQLGFYALAFQLISMPAEKITANLNKVVYPMFCRLQNDRARLRAWSLSLMGLLGFFGMPVMVGMLLVAHDGIVLVLGERWRPAILPFQLLSLSGLIKVYAAALPPLFNALGRPDISMKYTAVCTLVFPACFMAAGKMYGLVGICLVWAIVFPLIVGGLVWITSPLTGFGLWDACKRQGAILAGVLFMTAVVLGAQWLTGDMHRAGRLAVAIAAGMAAYTAAMLILTRHTALADLRALFRQTPLYDPRDP